MFGVKESSKESGVHDHTNGASGQGGVGRGGDGSFEAPFELLNVHPPLPGGRGGIVNGVPAPNP